MKSLPSRAFSLPDVHPRLRKRLARCTLDCGFKTSKSPALRGFVGGPQALATAALYLVLKSNGLHHSKNLPEKFSFSPNPIPRISPKSCRHNAVPNHFSSHFSASRTNGPRSLSQAKAGTPSAFRERSHTRAHTAKQGPSGRGRYHYPRHVLHIHEHPRAGCQNGKLCRFWVLAGCASEERRKPSEQRCAYARRCSEASRPRWAA